MTTDAPAPPGTDGFGDVARRAVAGAAVEARSLGHQTLGTEHLLLGLLATEGSGAAVALSDAGVTLAAARSKVAEAVGVNRSGPAPADLPLGTTSRAGRALNRAVRFSHQGRAPAVATSHVLLGVLDVEGRAGQVLRGLGVDVNALRAALVEVDDEARPPRPPRPARSADPGPAPARAPDAAPPADRPSPSRAAIGAACPSCGTALTHDLAYRIVKARSEGLRTRDAVLYSCAGCGTVLGVGPA